MRNWVLTQPDNRDIYNQFIMQFRAQFLDSGKALRARNKLRSLKMSWPHIDQYIADFEQLVDDGEYDRTTPNVSNNSSQGYPALYSTAS